MVGVKKSRVKENPSQRKISSFFAVNSGPSLFSSIQGGSSSSKLSSRNNLGAKCNTLSCSTTSRDAAGISSVSPKTDKEPASHCIKPELSTGTSQQDASDGLHDSDPEILLCSPENKKQNVNSSISIILSQSPDEIPPTPDASVSFKSKCFSKNLNFDTTSASLLPQSSSSSSGIIRPSAVSLRKKHSFNRLSKKNNKPDLRVGVNLESSSTSSLSGKRPAMTGTGVSPDPKRNFALEQEIVEDKYNHCKLDLLGKFGNTSLQERMVSNESENLNSEPKLETKCSLSNKETNMPDVMHDEEVKNSIKNNSFMDYDEENSMHGDKAVICDVSKTCPKSSGIKCKQMSVENGLTGELLEAKNMAIPCKEELSSSQGFSTVAEPSYEKDSKEVLGMANVDDMFEDSLDDLFSDDISEHLEKLSPFKKPPKEEVTLNKEVMRLLDEGVGKESYCWKGNYSRHIVIQVERDHYGRELLLRLVSPHDHLHYTCTLAGFWSQSVVMEGDVVHILFTEAVDGHFTLDNNKGLIVINPDFLVSGTSVVSGVFCRRKAILNERFKGMEPHNQVMLIGSLVHELFQEVVKKKIQKYDDLDKLVKRLMSESRAVRDMYGLGLSQEKMYEEMTTFLPHIHTWSQKYLRSSNYCITDKQQQKQQQRKQWEGKITEILDIEENLWSPRFGVKGKIDMTVRIHQKNKEKIVPLELKTGRSTFSAEHKGQVTLYSMMSSDRRPDPEAGLLLYLRDGAMEEVTAREKEKCGLLQLRNEIVQHLTAKPIPGLGDQPPQLPSLPEPIAFDRACIKCGQLLTCTVYQAAVEQNIPQEPHPMAKLVPNTIAHLKESHLEYFRHWCLLLHLEMDDRKRDETIRALWTQDPTKRESRGDCLCNLVLDERVNVSEVQTSEFVQVLRRSPTHSSHTPLSTVSLQAGDSIIVSSESDIALSMGVILSIRESFIEISLDRDLCQYPGWREKVFHIDRYEYQNSMGTNFSNLARLLQDNPHNAKLRSLIIDREPPAFKKGLQPDVVNKGRHILKSLNKLQQRAVLKTLMTEGYSLLKGYPGTGKTSTIVAMVRMMVTLGFSVLITSYTHSAVDNILLKLRMYEMDFLRLGRTSRIHVDILPYADEVVTRKFMDVPSLSQFYDSKLVVATTCLGVNHVLFSKRTFDFCIIDESSQVLQAAALGPLFHASRFVLVGDPQQLPPVIKSTQAKTLGMSESLFVRLDSQGATSDLLDQYRMNGPIMRLANELMYNNQLKCGSAEVETASLQLLNYSNLTVETCVNHWLLKILEPSLESSVVFVDTCGSGRESRDNANRVINRSEAGLVGKLLHTLLKSGMTTDDVGVITPYRAQVMLIRDQLAREEVEGGRRVEVNTVDQYQGRDKSVVVYSCVRSGSSQADPGDILQDEHRLNVAVTRAKHKLVVVGDRITLQSYHPFRKLTALLENHQIYQLKDGVDGFHWQEYLIFSS